MTPGWGLAPRETPPASPRKQKNVQRSLLRGDGASAGSPGGGVPLPPCPGLQGVGAAPPRGRGEGEYKKRKCINLHILPQTPWGLRAPSGSVGLDPHGSSRAGGHRPGGSPGSPIPSAAGSRDTMLVFWLWEVWGLSTGPGGSWGGTTSTPSQTSVSPHPKQGRGILCCSSGGAPQPEWGQCDPSGGAPRQGGHRAAPATDGGSTRGRPVVMGGSDLPHSKAQAVR